jgi:outer membrane lipoprotein-sorting protein
VAEPRWDVVLVVQVNMLRSKSSASYLQILGGCFFMRTILFSFLFIWVLELTVLGQISEEFISSYFNKIQDFHVKCISKSFRQDKPHFIIEVEYWANKNKYAWRWVKKDLAGKQLEVRKFVFDGQNSFSLLPDKRLVVFPNHQRDQSFIFCENAFYLPFMLGVVEDKSPEPAHYFTPTLAEYSETKIKILKQSEDKLTKQKIVKFTGQREPLLGLECPNSSAVSVYLDATTEFPVKWEKSCTDIENEKRAHVWEIKEMSQAPIGLGKMLPYAKKSVRRVLFDDYEYMRSEIEISHVEINSEIGDEVFSIDPTEASLIEDIANQKLIKVPK